MKFAIAIAGTLLLSACSNQKAQHNGGSETAVERPSHDQSDALMRQAEADWAQLFVKDDPAVLQDILADDFSGFSSDGAVHNKAETIAAEKPDGKYLSAKLDSVTYHHFGDTVVAQGVESAQRRDHGPDLRLAWTDVWLFRDGKWQVIASHSNELPKAK